MAQAQCQSVKPAGGLIQLGTCSTRSLFLMSLLANALRQTLPRVPIGEQLSALIDPTWIAQALGQRPASHPPAQAAAEHAVWLVIGLALFRDRPLWQGLQQLDLSLDGQAPPAPSVSVQAPSARASQRGLFALLTLPGAVPG